MDQEDYTKLSSIFERIEKKSGINPDGDFKTCMGMISRGLHFDAYQKFKIYTFLSQNKKMIFPYIGIKQEVMDLAREVQMDMACHMAINKMQTEYISTHMDKISSIEEEMYVVLDILDTCNRRILQLEDIHAYFSGTLFMQYEDLFEHLKDILEKSHDYEISRYSGKIIYSDDNNSHTPSNGTISSIA